MQDNYILFDFDGVIVDSFAPAFEVSKLICPNSTEDDYRKKFEGNINDGLNVVFQHDKDCRHDIDFSTEYIPRIKERVTVVPDMAVVIRELAKSCKLIIISSTLTVPIQWLLEKFELAEYFTEIMGNDVHTSKVEKIQMVFSKYNTDPAHCVFITDTLGDIREATHTGVDAIGVSWGFQNVETLTKGKPIVIVENPKDLLGVVSDYFNK